jgi:uncharacterized repeat protein (TIGR03803 family)
MGLLPLITNRVAAQGAAPTYSVLYTFTGMADGGYPTGDIAVDRNGNLYGTTQFGGNTSSSCSYGSLGCGVVFEIGPAGRERALYTFSGGADGADPVGLIRGRNGDLYGMTFAGGNSSSSCPAGAQGCGVVFKVDPQGNETVLHTFSGTSDGSLPAAGLIEDTAGNLYGTTLGGGGSESNQIWGCGVIFKIDPEETRRCCTHSRASRTGRCLTQV